MHARLVGGAIALAAPTRFGTLTLVGDDWPTVRARMNRVAHALRRRVVSSRWCWHVEPNPQATGHHVHFFQRGSFIPQRELAAIADANGLGAVADIRRWQAPMRRGVMYGVKLAGVDYGLKAAADVDTFRTYLRVNGNRLVHASRGFWRDDDGNACGQRDAMAAWAARERASDDGRWLLMREDALPARALTAWLRACDT